MISKNRLVVLGSGTCFPAVSGSVERAHPGFLLEYLGTDDLIHKVLLECSQGIASRLVKIGVGPTEIKTVLISHAHPDHFALPHFAQTTHCHLLQAEGFSWEDKTTWPTIQVIAPVHIARSMRTLNGIFFEESRSPNKGGGLPFPILAFAHARGPSEPIHLPGGATVVTRRVYHGFGRVDAIGFRVTLPNGRVFAYSGDSGLCPDLAFLAFEADLFLCEASSRIGNSENAYTYGHLAPRQSGTIAKEARAKRLLLTHYSGADSPSEMIRDAHESGFTQPILIANDGDIYSFDD